MADETTLNGFAIYARALPFPSDGRGSSWRVFMPRLRQALLFPVYVYFGSKMCLQNQLKSVNDQFPEY